MACMTFFSRAAISVSHLQDKTNMNKPTSETKTRDNDDGGDSQRVLWKGGATKGEPLETGGSHWSLSAWSLLFHVGTNEWTWTRRQGGLGGLYRSKHARYSRRLRAPIDPGYARQTSSLSVHQVSVCKSVQKEDPCTRCTLLHKRIQAIAWGLLVCYSIVLVSWWCLKWTRNNLVAGSCPSEATEHWLSERTASTIAIERRFGAWLAWVACMLALVVAAAPALCPLKGLTADAACRSVVDRGTADAVVL